MELRPTLCRLALFSSLIAVLSACSDGGGNGSLFNLDLSTFQKADVVIGQADFSGDQSNRGGAAAADTLGHAYGNQERADGILYVADFTNDRVLGYRGTPVTNGEAADFVLGQPDFTSTAAGTAADEMDAPQSLSVFDNKLFVLEYANNRATVFDPAPQSGPVSASLVLGQSSFGPNSSACSAGGLATPEGLVAVGGRVIIADSGNNRVLIWNSIPTTNGQTPDLVLGQNAFDTCAPNDDNQDGSADADPTAATLNYPTGVWSDGDRLVVLDDYNNRALIWNNFPTSNFESADLVLGQSDFTHDTSNDDDQDGITDGTASARTFNDPYNGVDSNGRQLVIADSGNNRVLIWDSFPTSSFQPASHVLGQNDFSNTTSNDDDQDGASDGQPTARTLDYPTGVLVANNNTLIVTDSDNARVLIFRE